MPGSRDMTATAASNAALTTAQAYNGVKVEWGGGTGTQWYDDAGRTVDGQAFEQRVTDWGDPTSRLHKPGEWTVGLRDNDGALRAILDAEGTANKRVTLYQMWAGAAAADWVVLWCGWTEEKVTWSEDGAELTLGCLDYGEGLAGPITHVVNETDFPYASPDEFGQALPMVYGKKRGVRGAWVQGGGPLSHTTTTLGFSGTYVFVDNAEDFPASSVGSPIRVWIGRELVEGYFDAVDTNKFTITDRNIVAQNVTATWVAGSFTRLNIDSGDASGVWNGYAMRMKVATYTIHPNFDAFVGPYQYRTIRRHTNNGAEEVWVSAPMSDGRTNSVWVEGEYQIASGYKAWKPNRIAEAAVELSYDIVYARSRHRRGDEFRYSSGDACVFIVSDAEAAAVERVYALDGDRRVLLSDGSYTVNMADNQFVAELGGNCTTLTFTIPPQYIRWSISDGVNAGSALMGTQVWRQTMRRASNQIECEVHGPEEAAAVIEHPLRVLRHLALRVGLEAGRVDETSVTDAVTARANYRVGFAFVSERGRPADVLQDLARMVHCAVDWTQGTLRVVTLDNDLAGASAAKAISDSNRMMDSRRLVKAGLHEAVTQIDGSFLNHENEQRDTTVRDATAIATEGLHVAQTIFWCYQHQNPCEADSTWWLYRQRYVPDLVEVAGFINYLDLLPGDIVTAFGDKGWVEEVRAHPGTMRDDIDAVGVVVAVPPADWYDAGYVFPDPTYTDPPEPTDEDEDDDDDYDTTPPAPAPDTTTTAVPSSTTTAVPPPSTTAGPAPTTTGAPTPTTTPVPPSTTAPPPSTTTEGPAPTTTDAPAVTTEAPPPSTTAAPTTTAAPCESNFTDAFGRSQDPLAGPFTIYNAVGDNLRCDGSALALRINNAVANDSCAAYQNLPMCTNEHSAQLEGIVDSGQTSVQRYSIYINSTTQEWGAGNCFLLHYSVAGANKDKFRIYSVTGGSPSELTSGHTATGTTDGTKFKLQMTGTTLTASFWHTSGFWVDHPFTSQTNKGAGGVYVGLRFAGRRSGIQADMTADDWHVEDI